MRIARPARSTLRLLPLLAAPLAACGEPIDPSAMADQAALRAREIVHQTGAGVSFAGEEDSGLEHIASGMSHAADGLAGSMPAPLPPGTMAAMASSPMARTLAGLPSMQDTEEQLDDTADMLRDWLRQRILADENLESRGDDQAVYLLRPEVTCRALPKDTDPPGTLPAVDSKCVDQLTRVAVRIAVRADGDGARFDVLIGPDRLQLSAFIIHSNLLAVETDLAMAYGATRYIDETLGSDSPTDMTQFEALAGRLRYGLRKDGDRKVTFSASVLNAIHVATRDAAGAPGPDVTIGAADPALAVTADGATRSLTVKLATGATDVLTTWDPAGGGAPNRDLHVGVGGVTGQATFTEADDQVRATGVGIGATVVEVRGTRLFDLNLNPNDARRFDLTIALNDAGQPRVEVTPRFDLSLGFHLGQIAGELTEAPPSYFLDETYRYRLDAGGAPAAVQAVPATATFAGGLQVLTGALTLSSDKVTDPVTVPAGKCLTGLASAPAGTHPLLGAVSVVDCP